MRSVQHIKQIELWVQLILKKDGTFIWSIWRFSTTEQRLYINLIYVHILYMSVILIRLSQYHLSNTPDCAWTHLIVICPLQTNRILTMSSRVLLTFSSSHCATTKCQWLGYKHFILLTLSKIDIWNVWSVKPHVSCAGTCISAAYSCKINWEIHGCQMGKGKILPCQCFFFPASAAVKP